MIVKFMGLILFYVCPTLLYFINEKGRHEKLFFFFGSIWKVKSPIDSVALWLKAPGGLDFTELSSFCCSGKHLPRNTITSLPRREGKGRNFSCSAASLSWAKITFNTLPSRTFLVRLSPHLSLLPEMRPV